MTTTSDNRRRFLQAAGATGVVALAGCLGRLDGDDDKAGNGGGTTDGGLSDPAPVDVDRIAADPTDVPPPVDWSEPRTHEISLETREVTAEVEPGVTVDFMTFEGQIPGPMIRVRRGDTIDLTFEVPAEYNAGVHNVDFHAVYGPGGGADATTLTPGEEPARIRFTADYPGVHIYHCAVPNMDQHISLGMFGAILVEPEEGLPPVDRELYLGQHELYTTGEVGEEGHHQFDFDAAANEDPTYVLLNGEAYGFTEDGAHGPLHAERDERIRLYLANGGPNLTSSWHAIGNVWSRLYRDGDLVSDPARYVETTSVPPGSVSCAEIETPVPGPIKLVDHALSRVVRRGLLAVIDVEGQPNPDVYEEL